MFRYSKQYAILTGVAMRYDYSSIWVFFNFIHLEMEANLKGNGRRLKPHKKQKK